MEDRTNWSASSFVSSDREEARFLQRACHRRQSSIWRSRVAPHSPYFGPGLLATLHVLAAAPQEMLVERLYVNSRRASSASLSRREKAL